MSEMTSHSQAAGNALTPVSLTSPFDVDKFENVMQVGGIQIADLQSPLGSGRTTRVAFVNTGSGLRFTVALDRGGDIVEASYNQHSLAYLTPNGYLPPSRGYDRGLEWLRSWAGGLLTSCGPVHMGGPREEDGTQVSLHGHHSNTPASVEMVVNPDPHRGRHEMLLSLVIRDSRMFGPVLEVRRQIQCTLGVPAITLYDQVINRSNERCPHNWLYHINLGYPLVDRDARLIYRGKASHLPAMQLTSQQYADLKVVPDSLPEHAGPGQRVVVVDMDADAEGQCHAGIINRKIGLGLEISWAKSTMPRLANWQHFGPAGSYVTGVEPFSGSLVGKAADTHPEAHQWLSPGDSKRYCTHLRVLTDPAALDAFARQDGPLTPES